MDKAACSGSRGDGSAAAAVGQGRPIGHGIGEVGWRSKSCGLISPRLSQKDGDQAREVDAKTCTREQKSPGLHHEGLYSSQSYVLVTWEAMTP